MHSKLSSTQHLQLAEIISLLTQSLQERATNDTHYAFTNVPSANKEIQRICLHSKYSILQNIPKPHTTYDSDLGVILPVDIVKMLYYSG